LDSVARVETVLDVLARVENRQQTDFDSKSCGSQSLGPRFGTDHGLSVDLRVTWCGWLRGAGSVSTLAPSGWGIGGALTSSIEAYW
jgi:hypothetical protein